MAVPLSAKVVPPRRAGGLVPGPSTWGAARRGRCPRRLNRSPDAGRAKRRGRSPTALTLRPVTASQPKASKAPERLWRRARLQIRRPSSPVAGLVGGLAFRGGCRTNQSRCKNVQRRAHRRETRPHRRPRRGRRAVLASDLIRDRRWWLANVHKNGAGSRVCATASARSETVGAGAKMPVR